MILPEPGDYADLALQRIAELGAHAAEQAGCFSPITISAGVARYPVDALDPESLLEKADERMYENKHARKLMRTRTSAC